MISLFDADAPFADDSAMGYQRYTTDFKLARLKRYFTPPMKPVRDLSAELGLPFSTLAEWVIRAAGVVKPFVIDRKNFLFSKSVNGAEASATMMTVIRTALRNGLMPERYLAWLFENSGRLPVARLMPWSEDVPDSCKALAE